MLMGYYRPRLTLQPVMDNVLQFPALLLFFACLFGGASLWHKADWNRPPDMRFYTQRHTIYCSNRPFSMKHVSGVSYRSGCLGEGGQNSKPCFFTAWGCPKIGGILNIIQHHNWGKCVSTQLDCRVPPKILDKAAMGKHVQIATSYSYEALYQF